MDGLEGDDSASGIHETVRTEVRHAIFEIQNDLENVCLSLIFSFIFCFILF